MPDSTLKQAVKEAMASAKGVILHTIELRHPSFTQPIRIVRDREDLTAYLEASAPVNAGQQVTFVAYAFDFTKPEIGATGIPQLTLTIDNVAREISTNVENALTSSNIITMTYREYLSNDLSGPQNDPPLTLDILTIKADVFKVTATAGFVNLNNKKFPTKAYDSETFPGLVN